MNYVGYDWSLSENGIDLDKELNLDRLGWNRGDYFRLVDIDGRAVIQRIDPLEKFLIDGK